MRSDNNGKFGRGRLVILAVLCGLWASFSSVHGQIIPSDRLYTEGWRTAGVRGGIPNRTIIYTTINSTGDTTDRTSAINNAIANCPAGQVVMLGPGTFRCNGSINFANKNGAVLRGQGQGVTILDCRESAEGVLFGNGASDWPWNTDGAKISTDEAKGQTVLSMVSTTSYTVGNRIRLSQDPDLTLPVIDVSSVNNRVQFHTTTITAKDASTITIEDPLPFALKTALNPSAHVINDGFASNSGLENLTVDCGNSAGPVVGIKMWNADNCWVYNVRVIEPSNQGLYANNMIHCTIQKCYFDRIENAGSNGAGLLVERSSMNLFIDNIIYKSFPNLEINFGCTGNVFAYNMWDDATALAGSWGMSVNMNHGAHNSYNLYEGNVTPSFQPDGYFGSVSHDTIFRNRVHGYQAYNKVGDSLGSVAIKLKRFTRYYNVVGNVLGIPRSGAVYEQTTDGASSPAIYQLGYPNIGNHGFSGTAEPSKGDFWSSWRSSTGPSGYQERDLDVVNTLIRRGNYNTVNNAVPAGESLSGETLPNSLYLDTKPVWFNGLKWPPFDPLNPVIDMNASVQSIPAGYRYLNGGAEPPGGGGGDTVAPSSPGNPAVTATSATQISVTWTASTDNVGVTGYRVERSQGAGSTAFAQVGTPSGTSFSDSGLSAGTVYNYRIRATDAAGNLGGYSTTASATTPNAPDTIAPTAPTNPSAAAVSASQINLTWTAATDNVGVTGYRVERSQGSGSTSFSQVATPTTTSFNNTALSAGTVYNYRVRAVDAAGNLGGYSATVTATTTTTSDTTPPTNPSNVTASAAGATQVNLSWTASTDASGVTSYLIERSTGQGSTSYLQIGTSGATSYADTGLSASTVYNYRLRASDAAGNRSGYSSVVTTTTLAEDPNGLVAAYSFDEGSGGVVQDQSMLGNDGTVTNASWAAAGKYGRALLFNGTSSLVTIPYAPSLNVSNALTLEAWVRPVNNDASQWRSVVYRPNTAPGDVNYVLQGVSRTSGEPSFGLAVATANLYSPVSLLVDTWSHVAVTYDGTAMRLYINGEEQGNQPQTGALPSSTQPLLMGMNWAGLIDEVRVYNRALSLAEIRADMANPVSGGARPSAPTGLTVQP